MRKMAAFLSLSLAMLSAGAARAQSGVTGGALRGTVLQQTGEPLPGATVTVTNLETNVTRTVTTDTGGAYRVSALPPGSYNVTAEMSGFATQRRESLSLHLGQTAAVDFTLSVAGPSEEATVEVTAESVQITRNESDAVLNQTAIENLPINGRNFISFSLITPGVVQDRIASGVVGTSGLSFTGQSARANNIMVDGFDNNDTTTGGVRGLFSQEAIREFQVLTDSYSAEFGEASGGVVNIITRGGTNRLHGEAYAFYRNDALDARDHFERFDVFGDPVDRPRADFGQWQWGGTLGGPLRRGKTFFFLSFERSDTDTNNFVNIAPSVADALRAARFPVELGNVPYTVESSQALAKIDHQWSPRNTLSLRGSWFDLLDENADPFGGTVARSAGASLQRTDWFVSAAETDVLSARWMHEARVQYSRLDQASRALDSRCDGECDLAGNDRGQLQVRLGGRRGFREIQHELADHTVAADQRNERNRADVLGGEHRKIGRERFFFRHV